MQPMETTINVIMDFSGSITELGKAAVLKSMIYRIRTIAKQKGAKVVFVLWNEDIVPFRGKWDTKPMGKTNPSALIDFIAAKPPGEKYILLSDGIGDTDSFVAIRQCLAKSRAVLSAIAVGKDVDIWSLKQISYEKTVWHATDIVTAINFLCYGIFEENTP